MAEHVSLEPESEDDWELVELNADYVEQFMLQQACLLDACMASIAAA